MSNSNSINSSESNPLLLAEGSPTATSTHGSLHFKVTWERKDIVLFVLESTGWILFSVAWSYLFVLPLCGMLFHCQCIWIWDSSSECQSTQLRAESCPFCGSWGPNSISTSVIPQWGVVPVMVAAALLMRYKKPKMYLIRFIVVILVFFVFVILASIIFELATGYPHFM